jgi:hypothetical protein
MQRLFRHSQPVEPKDETDKIGGFMVRAVSRENKQERGGEEFF